MTSEHGGIITRAFAGERLAVEDIIRLLEIETGGDEFDGLLAASKSLVHARLGTEGRMWCAIGLDHKRCSMNCQFCSLADEWANIDEETQLADEQVMAWAHYFIENQASFLVLRTGEDYEVERLCWVGRAIRQAADSDYRLVANTRELTPEQARALRDSGFDGIYKTIRMREGIDTVFDVDHRLQTIKNMRAAGLDIYALVEPIGPEHTYQEIAENILLLRDEIRPVLIGAMARVPVPGSPLEHYGMLSELELAKITAVVVLAVAPHLDRLQAVCSHPPSEALMRAGASAVVVEVGAIPRDDSLPEGEWRHFGVADARTLLTSAGWPSPTMPTDPS